MKISLIDLTTKIIGIFNYLIDFPVMLIESGLRKRRPTWEVNPFLLTPYYLMVTFFASIALVCRAKITLIILCIFLMVAMELQATWKCALLSLGRPAIIYPKRIGLKKAERLSGGRELLTKTAFYIGISAFAYSIYFFSYLFLFIFTIDDSSFQGIRTFSRIGQLWDFIYFSFITITTVGYGDIYPVSFIARSFVIIENIMGIFFIVFLFTIFISFHTQGLQKKE